MSKYGRGVHIQKRVVESEHFRSLMFAHFSHCGREVLDQINKEWPEIPEGKRLKLGIVIETQLEDDTDGN